MEFTPAKISGMYFIKLDIREDERGNFVRSYSLREFAAGGIDFQIKEFNQAYTKKAGMLRGLHWQAAPGLQAKVFQCIEGRVYDVIADVRPDSPTFGQWEGVTLTAGDGKLLYAPPGTAHGYMSLVDNCKLHYAVTGYYSPQDEKGLRYNDPMFNISWPLQPKFISEKDSNWPDFQK